VKWIVATVILIAAGIIVALYTPVAQDAIRDKAVEVLNRQPGLDAKIDTFRLRFPLRLTLAGVSLVRDGDTLVSARRLDADVAMLPLFAGNVDVQSLRLNDAYYRMGTPDSAMYLRLRAGVVSLSPAKVKLSPMDINVIDGEIAHARVSITLNPDSSSTDTITEQSPLEIGLDRLKLTDFAYDMRMMPTIDSLGTHFDSAILSQGHISLTGQTVRLRSLAGNGLDASYIAPASADAIPATVAGAAPDTTSRPWTVEIDSIAFSHSKALYTTAGVVPQPGLDFSFIQVSDLDLNVNHFYNQATTLSLPISLQATERCGVTLNASGTFAMDSAGMYFRDFNISTPSHTVLAADGMLGIGDLTSDPDLPIRLQAEGDLAISDAQLMFPVFSPYLTMFGENGLIGLDMTAEGSPSRLNISQLSVKASDVATLSAEGYIGNFFSPDLIVADLDLDGRILDGKSIAHAMLDPKSGIAIPPLSLSGHIGAKGSRYSADLTATSLSGKLALDGSIDSRPDGGYDIYLSADDFPVNAFMPDLGVGRVSATISGLGHGYDLFSPETALEAKADISKAEYNGYTYSGINLTAELDNGNADIKASARNADLSLYLKATGNLSGSTYSWTADLDGEGIDLQTLRFSEYPATLNLSANATAQLSSDGKNIDVNLHLPDLEMTRDVGTISIADVNIRFLAADSTTTIDLHNRDLAARIFSPMGLYPIMDRVTRVSEQMDSIMVTRRFNVNALQTALPPFEISATAGSDNLINDILAPDKMSIARLDLNAANDSLLSLKSQIQKLNTGTMTLDTVNVALSQANGRLHLLASVKNAPGNLDEYALVDAHIIVDESKVSMRIAQQNREGRTGFDLGAFAMINAQDNVLIKFFPFNPTIGYKPWTINPDNFLSYHLPTRHIDANLHMDGDNSSLAIYTQHDASHSDGEDSETASHQEDIILDIKDIHLADWIKVNPFAPPVTGDLSARLNLNWDGGENINGKGNIGLSEFYYDNRRVGSFLADLDISTNTSGTVRAKADLSVDGKKSITLTGNLNDSIAASPFNLDLSVIHFPLTVVNPFLPDGVARLNGTLNGSLDVSGDSNRPRLDGSLRFDSTTVFLGMTATNYHFSPVDIPVTDNLVTFKDFAISGPNHNPLNINGTVDISDFASPKVDLTMDARNMMIVDTKRASSGADIFGKAYIDLDASIKGSTRFMAVNADMKVLSGTNVTYQLTTSASAITDRSMGEMVKFVNLADSTAVADAETIADPGMMLALNALLTIQNNTSITVNLPTGARDKVVIEPQGTLNYTMAPMSDGRLTGRINIDDGKVSYTLPVVMSEKQFTFDAGSYVAFNGDMMNPTLNIHLTDVLKANVTQNGQNSRLVNFDVMMGVTGSLDRMDVAFDLRTDDDITVANELQSMSAEQRASQAMNMLLYNVYTGPGTKASANLSANPLYSFLESQVNNWAANNIKGVDLSFGIDQYKQTTDGTTSSTMSYSYQISKTLFNDRFKIVVGGNYSDGAEDQSLADNLFNNIAFEYYLNSAHTMLLKIFRKTGFESILEGEVTQTGIGFTYRRRVPSLIKMVPKFMRPLFQRSKKTSASPEKSSIPPAPAQAEK